MVEPRPDIKVLVTGTNIPRSDVESALPVQLITRDDIERSGSTTVAELMSKVSANIRSFNDALSVGNQIAGPSRPGLSTVNLRGIGDGSTLVLINGRRVANYAFDGGAVDVNSIPLSAIEKVEILKDGASAIYGTDAIAGVVNFILRKDFRGVEVRGYGSWTEQGGGDQYQAALSMGYGDFATDKFNAFVSFTYQKDKVLRAADREFARTGYRPEDGLIAVSASSFPANIVAGRNRLLNPNYASGCAPPVSIPFTIPVIVGLSPDSHACAYDFGSLADLLPQVERASVLGRATFQLNPAVQLFVEGGYTSNKLQLSLPATPVFFRFLTNLQPLLYPAGGPFYPTAYAAAQGISGDLNLNYRTVQLGNRVNDVKTEAWRGVAGLEGATAGWDYSAAIVYSHNRQSDDFSSGYVAERAILDAMATGLINPFGPSGSAGDALLASTQIYGDFHSAKGTTWLIDAKASREVHRLPAGPLAIAFGAEGRREELENTFDPIATSGDVIGAGGIRQSANADRSVWAAYAEASVPLATGFESQLAVRYDDYSDFGGTANPKVALRWQPIKTLLLRTSWGTGFRAPTLYDLHTPLQNTFTSGTPDPVRCPVTDLPEDCFSEFPAVIGGNPTLRPETSEQFNAGVVWEPAPGLTLALDYWKIRKSNAIAGLSEDVVLRSDSPWASTNILRGPVDPAFPTLPGPISNVILWTENVGSIRTSGYDVDVTWRGPATPIGRFTFGFNGTYISTFRIQNVGSDPLYAAGTNDFGIVPRWRHNASLNWSQGPWSGTLAQTFQSAYDEYDGLRCDEMGNCDRRRGRHVQRLGSSGAIHGVQRYDDRRRYKKSVRPRSAIHPARKRFAPGYDSQYADPRGRAYYVRLTYAFK